MLHVPAKKCRARTWTPLWRRSTRAVTQAKSYAKGDDLVESAIKENVHRSAADLLANSEIIRIAVKSGNLTVIEAEYELETGRVVRLNAPANGRIAVVFLFLTKRRSGSAAIERLAQESPALPRAC